MTVEELLHTKRITEDDYETYMVLEVDDRGRQYLKRLFEKICMEDPLSLETESPYARQDGRISLIRDMKYVIKDIQNKLKLMENQ